MNRLQERRLELGLSQPAVSAALKKIDPRMDAGMVSRFERGACLPTPEVLEALESVLQATRTELFDKDDLGVISGEDAQDGRKRGPAYHLMLHHVPVGRRNAIPREVLAAKLGMSDRNMRKTIEEARRDGLLILCEQNGRGYYQSDDIAEMRRQYMQDTARALSILRRRKPLRDALRAAGEEV